MMKRIFVLFLLVLFGLNSTAQVTRVTVTKAVFDSLHFAEPQFQSGVVFFNDDTRDAGALNIDLVRQEVVFIDKDGNQMVLSNNNQVRMVMLGKTAYYMKGANFIKLIALSKEEVGLGKVTNISVLEEEKKGAYGYVSETTNIKMLGAISTDGRLYDFKEDQPIPVIIKEYPYIYYNGKFFRATKKALLKAFPDGKKEIEAYLSANNVNFDIFADVEKMYNILTKE